MINILTVDDSPMVRRMLNTALVGAGYCVRQAADGLEGLDMLMAIEAYDLIITDINMPRLDGFEFIRRARALPLHRRTPILVLSTESREAPKARARAAGASCWLGKPFCAESLLAVVDRLVRG